ncbi:MAG: hypothetical protein QM790_10925 [Nibricoccus sp.]
MNPPSPASLVRNSLGIVAVILATSFLAGCSNRPPRGAGPAEMAAAIPSLSASDTFFDGALLVEANLGRGFMGGMGGPGGRGGGGGRRGGGMRMGGGMGGGPGGMGGPGGGMGGPEGMGEGPSGGFGGGPRMGESNLPPVGLRLRLTNKSKETIEVVFVQCKSELGDFAVRPEKLALAPDQSGEPDPMTSRLGIPSDELILRVGLKMSGKVEQKDLVLRKATNAQPTASPKP